MKVIFLDIDGVLNCASTVERCGGPFFVEDRKLAMLSSIVKTTGAKCVLSSTWRGGWLGGNNFVSAFPEVRGLFDKFNEFGIECIDKTGYSTSRGNEIKLWLNEHPEVTDFVILDDDNDMGELEDHLVKTSWAAGLTVIEQFECIRRLGGVISETRTTDNESYPQ